MDHKLTFLAAILFTFFARAQQPPQTARLRDLHISDQVVVAAHTNSHSATAQGGFWAGGQAMTIAGGAVGEQATCAFGGAVGAGATSSSGGAIGMTATSLNGGACGGDAKTGDGFAGGFFAETIGLNNSLLDAIQLGTGRNTMPRTLQVYSNVLLCANGTIPRERTPDLVTLDELIVVTNTIVRNTYNDFSVSITDIYDITSNCVTYLAATQMIDLAVFPLWLALQDHTNWHNHTPQGGFWGGSNATTQTGGSIGREASSTSGGAVGQQSTSTTGGAVGMQSTTTTGGAVGQEASSDLGGAVGFYATTIDGGAVGQQSTSTTGGAVGGQSTTTTGGAVGQEASSTIGGAVGQTASSTGGGAMGWQATTTYGGAVGQEAISDLGGAIGASATSASGGAIGMTATSLNGGACGENAKTGDGFAGGYRAQTLNLADVLIDAVQLGTGLNTEPGTLQIYSNRLLNADGTIPAERLPAPAAPTWLGITNLTTSVTITNDLERPIYLHTTGDVSIAFAGLRPPQPLYLVIQGPDSVTWPMGTHFVGGGSFQTNQANHFIVWQHGATIFANPITTSED